MNWPGRVAVILSVAFAVACTPSFNWREVSVSGGSVVALFPCRVDEHERALLFDGQAARMSMLSCQAEGMTFAVSQIRASSVARARELPEKLISALKANVSGRSEQSLAWPIPGMDGNAVARRESWTGSLLDGASIRLEVGAFSSDTTAFQVTVSGEKLDLEAANLFFSSFKVMR